MTKEEHEKIMAVAVRDASTAGYSRGFDQGYANGLDAKVEQRDSELGVLIEELIYKRDVLGLDIGDPLELMRGVYEHG